MAKRIISRTTKTAKKFNKKKENIEIDDNYKFQTIASTDRNYTTYDIMAEYPSIEEARTNYQNDIKEWKDAENHEGYLHYGIKRISNDIIYEI